MHTQNLTELKNNLQRFAEANDPRNKMAAMQIIKQCFESCRTDDKETLTEMFELFWEIKKSYPDCEWKDINKIVFTRTLLAVDRFIHSKQDALSFLSDGETPRFIVSHLMKRFEISKETLVMHREVNV